MPVTQRNIERELDRLNYCNKSLDALAGGDDTFFVILDDREDVWLKEKRDYISGRKLMVPSECLIKIPPYFFFAKDHGDY